MSGISAPSPEEPRRQLASPAYPEDTGAGDEAVRRALAAYLTDPTEATRVAAFTALATSRLLVPVVAVLGEVEFDEAGLAHDKSSDMATVLMTRPDGRRGLLAFTGSDTMAAWDPAARPVATPAVVAAQSALQDGADALLVDLAGPARLVVEHDDLRALARGWRPTLVAGSAAWIGRPTP